MNQCPVDPMFVAGEFLGKLGRKPGPLCLRSEELLPDTARQNGKVKYGQLMNNPYGMKGEDIRRGVVYLAHGWGRRLFYLETRPSPDQQGTNANLLTEDENINELCGMPVYNAIPCNVRRSGK